MELAADCHLLVDKGIDPVTERERLRQKAQRDRHLLRGVAREAFESRKADLEGDGFAGRWFTPLELHILYEPGRVPVGEISQRDIRDAFEPMRYSTAATARKAVDRLKIVMDHAAVLGLDVDLLAVAKAKALLGRQPHGLSPVCPGQRCRPSTPASGSRRLRTSPGAS